ncbi:uncharacterized protein LOC118430583 [Branchiostoma floridae]|uniref:Uncharacterized protein LOC118430583 n=1 Tax=Branchiostoma floridae TaxID=7739 RepID=A0A9J7MAK2_BRAFL|nr:uncharacterized protein LOC118430583 [Branchiostoma floridae]
MYSESENEERPRTISDLTKPRHATQQTAIGPTRSCGSLEKHELLFLVLTILGLAATLGLTIYRLTSVEKTTADFTFALVLIINTVACLIFVVHGLMRERPYEVAIFIIADVIVLIYCIVNYAEKPRWDNPTEHAVKLVRLILVVVVSVIVVPLAVYILVSFYQSRNLIFRTVGANAELQDMCDLTFFNEALLKLDFQLELSMVVLVMNNGTKLITEDIIVLSVGTVFVLVWATLGYLSMRFESKVLVIIFLLLWWCEPAYIIYKMVDVAQQLHNKHEDPTPEDANLVPAAAIACGIAACLVHSLVLMVTWKVWGNFGNGLKEKVYGQPGTDDSRHVVEEETRS